jgi:hypothetical protein
MDASEIERLLDAPARRGAPRAELTGPVTVLASEPAPDGATRLDIQASRLVSLDPDDPALADVSVAVPVPATVVVGETGRLEMVEVQPLDDETERQARAYVRNLVTNGSVRGLAAAGPVRRGPPSRPTHEVALDSRGRKVIRRIGFTATLDPKAQHGPTSHHETGGTKDA